MSNVSDKFMHTTVVTTPYYMGYALLAKLRHKSH